MLTVHQNQLQDMLTVHQSTWLVFNECCPNPTELSFRVVLLRQDEQEPRLTLAHCLGYIRYIVVCYRTIFQSPYSLNHASYLKL